MFYENKELISYDRNESDGLVRVVVRGEVDSEGNETQDSFDVSAWEFDVNYSEKNPIDASQARTNRAVYVVDQVYDVLKKLDIRTEELSFYIQKLLSKSSGVESAAIISALGHSQEDDIRISDWEKQL